MYCRLCGKNKELANSHIIPKCFFMYLYPEGDKRSLIMISKKYHSKKSPIGIYEKLLCFNCEERLGVFDGYAKKLLLEKKSGHLQKYKDDAYIIYKYDYFKLKSFFLSLLWRASVSSREEFKLIDAGPFEDALKNFLLQRSVGKYNDFSIFITKFESEDEKVNIIAENNILSPAKQKIDGLNYSIFYLSGGYKVYIKVDKRQIQNTFKSLTLKANSQIIILRMSNFENTSEYKILLEAVS